MPTDFYNGQSELVTITFRDNTGTAIPHATLDDVRVVLRHQNGATLHKWRKVSPSAWTALTDLAGAGQYTFEITEAMGKEWPVGKVFMEWQLQITEAAFVDKYRPMGSEHLFNVVATNYAKE
jgi:hypothetical protein